MPVASNPLNTIVASAFVFPKAITGFLIFVHLESYHLGQDMAKRYVRV